MSQLEKDGGSSVRPEYVVVEIDGELKAGLEAMLKSGDAESYTDAIFKLFKYWDGRLDCDDVSNEHSAVHPKLSKRQKQLIPLLNKGLTNREIADTLNLSEHTVKVHLWRFFKKFKVNSRTQLLYVLRRNNLGRWFSPITEDQSFD